MNYGFGKSFLTWEYKGKPEIRLIQPLKSELADQPAYIDKIKRAALIENSQQSKGTLTVHCHRIELSGEGEVWMRTVVVVVCDGYGVIGYDTELAQFGLTPEFEKKVSKQAAALVVEEN